MYTTLKRPILLIIKRKDIKSKFFKKQKPIGIIA